jgi:hypothetical protein
LQRDADILWIIVGSIFPKRFLDLQRGAQPAPRDATPKPDDVEADE